MQLKHTLAALATLALVANAGRKKLEKPQREKKTTKRKGGRRHFKRHQAHMANQAFDPERMSALDAPGSDALWEYIQSGEYADFTAEWYADALAMGMIADDDRSDGQVYSEIGFRAASLGDIEAAGGLSYRKKSKCW